MSDLPASISEIIDRLSDPSIQSDLKGFTKTLQLSLTDIGKDYFFKIEDGKLVSFDNHAHFDAEIIVTTKESLMQSIISKKTSPVAAFMSGDLKAKGSLDDLFRLQKLLS